MTLTSQQVQRLCSEIAEKFQYEDFVWVLSHYTGNRKPSDVLTRSKTPFGMATDCFHAVRREGTLFPFLSRVVEHKWQDEPLRSILVAHVRSLVRSSSRVTPHVETIVGAVAALLEVSGHRLSPDKCQGPSTCLSVRKEGTGVLTIIESLNQFEALKDLHDSLHVLLVEGADWLDESDTSVTPSLPSRELVDMIGKLGEVATAVEARVPPAARESCRRCREVATAAVSRLTPGASEAEAEFAQAQLRALVDREPEIIDGVMFVVSRDLPIRMLRDLFVSGGKVAGAVGGRMGQAAKAFELLSEALRARILEHALWQATEARIRAVTRTLNDPGGVSPAIFEQWRVIRGNLATLVDTPPNEVSIDDRFLDAILAYDQATPLGGPAPAREVIEACTAEMVAAFDEFRLDARQVFLDVDKALKAEFASLMPLRASLQALLAAVGRDCRCNRTPP